MDRHVQRDEEAGIALLYIQIKVDFSGPSVYLCINSAEVLTYITTVKKDVLTLAEKVSLRVIFYDFVLIANLKIHSWSFRDFA